MVVSPIKEMAEMMTMWPQSPVISVSWQPFLCKRLLCKKKREIIMQGLPGTRSLDFLLQGEPENIKVTLRPDVDLEM